VGDPAFAPREAWVESMMPMLQGQLGVKAANSATVLGTVHTNASIPLVNVLLCTGEPAFLRNRFGKGQSFYFAGSIGRQYRRCGQANVLRLLRRVLDEAVGSAAPAALDGPASVELFAHWRNGQRQLVVNLVNVFAGLSRSDGSALGRSGQAGTHDMRHDEYEESPRLSEVVVRFRPHQGKMAREVYLAPDAKKLAAKVENGDTVVSVRNLSEHAMIVAEY
jgi:hypothetical protein